ncbi:MAG TPA: hypothetical protein VH000_10845 [Rhizomicrobium sp.]|jgi:hypothetical protein|nr:hypothetical protein [Rhizomicrobium sp.]
MSPRKQLLIEKIEALNPEEVHEVEDFVDFLAVRAQKRGVARWAEDASAAAFASVWNNPEDDVYDTF